MLAWALSGWEQPAQQTLTLAYSWIHPSITLLLQAGSVVTLPVHAPHSPYVHSGCGKGPLLWGVILNSL